MRVSPELEARMQGRLERRDQRVVRPHKRIGKDLMKIAKSQLFAELGKRGGAKRAERLTVKQRSEIARTAALSRWQRHRAAVKAASVSEGANA
jgi:hypothetical protein